MKHYIEKARAWYADAVFQKTIMTPIPVETRSPGLGGQG